MGMDKLIFLILVCMGSQLLLSCTTKVYHGENSYKWQSLTLEQKQMIVDESFEREFGSAEGNKNL